MTRVDRGSPAACTGAPRPVELPRLLVLTDRHQATRPLRDVVAAVVDAGVRAVVLREKDLPDDQRSSLVDQLAPIVHGAGAMLLTAGSRLPGSDGVHQPAGAGPVATGGALTGRSCHDAGELRAAERDGVHYATVSPVYATASKPGYGPALGEHGLASVVASTPLPVYALGGVDSGEAVTACLRAGAHGAAVMGAVMRARDPGSFAGELLAAAEAGRP